MKTTKINKRVGACLVSLLVTAFMVATGLSQTASLPSVFYTYEFDNNSAVPIQVSFLDELPAGLVWNTAYTPLIENPVGSVPGGSDLDELIANVTYTAGNVNAVIDDLRLPPGVSVLTLCTLPTSMTGTITNDATIEFGNGTMVTIAASASVTIAGPPAPPVPDGPCLVMLDRTAIRYSLDSVGDSADAHGVDKKWLINAETPTVSGNPWMKWSQVHAGDLATIDINYNDNMGWFQLPASTPWPAKDFADGIVPQSELKEIVNVVALDESRLSALVGKQVVAVVYNDEIEMLQYPDEGDLSGMRLGRLAFTVISVDTDGVHVRIDAPVTEGAPVPCCSAPDIIEPSGPPCLVTLDSHVFNYGMGGVSDAAARYTVDKHWLINDTSPTTTGNPWLNWSVHHPGDRAVIALGKPSYEQFGWYQLPAATPWPVEDYLNGTVPQSELGDVYDVVPLDESRLAELVGKQVVAVVNTGEIEVLHYPEAANLSGPRSGRIAFTVMGIDEDGVHVRIDPPVTDSTPVPCCSAPPVPDPHTGPACLVALDSHVFNYGMGGVSEAADRYAVDKHWLINDTSSTTNGNPWINWSVHHPGDRAVIALGKPSYEQYGWYQLPAATPWPVEDYLNGTVPQADLGDVPNVVPLDESRLADLVGKQVVAVVNAGEISVLHYPEAANLSGPRSGRIAFTVMGIDEDGVHVRIDPPVTDSNPVPCCSAPPVPPDPYSGPPCLVALDPTAFHGGIEGLKDAADRHLVDEDWLINAGSSTTTGYPWMNWSASHPGDRVILEMREFGQGWFQFPDNPGFTLEDYVEGIVDTNDLDKIKDIVYFDQARVAELIGKRVVAVVYEDAIPLEAKNSLEADLSGPRFGKIAFTVWGIDEDGIHVQINPPETVESPELCCSAPPAWPAGEPADHPFDPGLDGGQIAVGTSTFISAIGKALAPGSMGDLEKPYDDVPNFKGVDFMNLADKLTSLPEAITNPNQKFKIIVANADLSIGIRLAVNSEYTLGDDSTYGMAFDYADTKPEDLPIYSLNGGNGTVKLEHLGAYFAANALLEGGVLPTKYGSVKDNIPGKNDEWRNGAFTIQAVAVNADGSDDFTTDLDLSNGGRQGVAKSGLLWESTIFCNWKGASYHEPGNDFNPGDKIDPEDL